MEKKQCKKEIKNNNVFNKKNEKIKNNEKNDEQLKNNDEKQKNISILLNNILLEDPFFLS